MTSTLKRKFVSLKEIKYSACIRIFSMQLFDFLQFIDLSNCIENDTRDFILKFIRETCNMFSIQMNKWAGHGIPIEHAHFSALNDLTELVIIVTAKGFITEPKIRRYMIESLVHNLVLGTKCLIEVGNTTQTINGISYSTFLFWFEYSWNLLQNDKYHALILEK